MIAYFSPAYLVAKFLNNINLSLFLLVSVAVAMVCAYSVFCRVFDTRQSRIQALVCFFLMTIFSALVYGGGIPVGILPDLGIALFAVWGVIHMRQEVSSWIWIPILLLIYFLFFSPDKLDIQFDNRYITVLKPFAYLIILYLLSASKVSTQLRPMVYGFLIFYPFLLLWYMAMWWYGHGVFMPRPNFMIENNFEIPPLLYCFIAIAFIYRDKDLRIYLLLVVGILLTGSRSGLVGLLAVSIFYLLTLSRKKIFLALFAGASALAYIVYLRASVSVPDVQNTNPIDRIQTFLRIYSFYDNHFIEILKYPLGVGIYQKIPINICNQFEGYADWFTGNFYNCDPLMLQSFVARALYQFGIYVLIFIPIAFYLELKRRMGWYLGFIALIPIMGASFSVGGFSNGLAFGSLLVCLLIYQQEHSPSLSAPPKSNGHQNGSYRHA